MNSSLPDITPARRLPAALVRPLRTAVVLALPVLALIGARAESRPNFIFFLTDDQPYNALGCTGNTVLQTPGMDRLAANGVLFEKAFATTAICCSTRASIYTGQYMSRHGIDDFMKPLSAAQMRLTFPVLLRQAGYRTAFLGKFAIGSPKVSEELSLPADQFDLWYGFPQYISYKQTENGKNRYLTTVMTEKAEEFLKTAKPDQPFCMIVALKELHGPLTYFDPEFPKPYTDAVIPRPVNLTHRSFDALPEPVRKSLNNDSEWIDNDRAYQEFMRRRYAYMARGDLAIVQIQQALKDRGLDKNTVVIFMSDHGTMDGAHGLSGKWLMYEESIHVPLIISDPRLPAGTRGRRASGMVLNIDIAPTILAMAGVPVPAGMQGKSIQKMLTDPEARVRDDWFYEHVYSDPTRPAIPKIVGVRTDRWKYTRYTDSNPQIETLFDLAADPHEENDLAHNPEQKEILERLRARCDEYRVAVK